MPRHVDALYKPEPADTPRSAVYLSELQIHLLRANIAPNATFGGYAVGRDLDRQLAAATLDLAAVADLSALRADVRRVHTDEQIKAGLHDIGRFTPTD